MLLVIFACAGIILACIVICVHRFLWSDQGSISVSSFPYFPVSSVDLFCSFRNNPLRIEPPGGQLNNIVSFGHWLLMKVCFRNFLRWSERRFQFVGPWRENFVFRHFTVNPFTEVLKVFCPLWFFFLPYFCFYGCRLHVLLESPFSQWRSGGPFFCLCLESIDLCWGCVQGVRKIARSSTKARRSVVKYTS